MRANSQISPGPENQMFKNVLLTIATSRGLADQLVNTLKNHQPPIGEVSVLFRDRSPPGARIEEFRKKTDRDESKGEIRGVFASLPVIRHHFLPGMDPLVASGVLGVALESITQGGVADRLIAFGLPSIEARSYEFEVAAGHYLIAIEPPDVDADARLQELLSTLDARQVCVVTSEAARTPVGHHNILSLHEE